MHQYICFVPIEPFAYDLHSSWLVQIDLTDANFTREAAWLELEYEFIARVISTCTRKRVPHKLPIQFLLFLDPTHLRDFTKWVADLCNSEMCFMGHQNVWTRHTLRGIGVWAKGDIVTVHNDYNSQVLIPIMQLRFQHGRATFGIHWYTGSWIFVVHRRDEYFLQLPGMEKKAVFKY